MSKNERDRFEREEKWWRVRNRDGGICQNCGRPAAEGVPQLAHIIANKRAMRRKYGSEVIDADDNVLLTCSLTCNAAVQVTNNPVERDALAEEIREERGYE